MPFSLSEYIAQTVARFGGELSPAITVEARTATRGSTRPRTTRSTPSSPTLWRWSIGWARRQRDVAETAAGVSRFPQNVIPAKAAEHCGSRGV